MNNLQGINQLRTRVTSHDKSSIKLISEKEYKMESYSLNRIVTIRLLENEFPIYKWMRLIGEKRPTILNMHFRPFFFSNL